MKNHLINILSILVSITLAFVAFLSFKYILPFALAFAIVRSIKKEGVYASVFNFFFLIGKGLDQTSCAAFKHLLNGLLLVDKSDVNKHEFGDVDETISSVLGINQLAKTLSWFGWVWVGILWVADPRYWGKGGHCINSIGE